MTEIRPVKHVFIDVVGYSKRVVEAQCDIIDALNETMKGVMAAFSIGEDAVVYLPTGDGMCLALIDATAPYDLHVRIAQETIHRIDSVHNKEEKRPNRQFEVRVGINQSDDNIIKDINGRNNVTGAGINNARRIMDLADGSQILVSSVVYDNLRYREKYSDAFRGYRAEVKHGLVLDVFQLVKGEYQELNTTTPSAFAPTKETETIMPKEAAYYLAHIAKNESFIKKALNTDSADNAPLRVITCFLARDSEYASRE